MLQVVSIEWKKTHHFSTPGLFLYLPDLFLYMYLPDLICYNIWSVGGPDAGDRPQFHVFNVSQGFSYRSEGLHVEKQGNTSIPDWSNMSGTVKKNTAINI